MDRLSQGNPVNEKAQEAVRILESVGLDVEWETCATALNGTGEEEDRDTLGADFDKELSFAEINQKRKQLAFAAFRDPDFLSRIHILDNLVNPNVEAMYQLFQRTGILGKLCYLPTGSAEERQELMLQLLVCKIGRAKSNQIQNAKNSDFPNTDLDSNLFHISLIHLMNISVTHIIPESYLNHCHINCILYPSQLVIMCHVVMGWLCVSDSKCKCHMGPLQILIQTRKSQPDLTPRLGFGSDSVTFFEILGQF